MAFLGIEIIYNIIVLNCSELTHKSYNFFEYNNYVSDNDPVKSDKMPLKDYLKRKKKSSKLQVSDPLEKNVYTPRSIIGSILIIIIMIIVNVVGLPYLLNFAFMIAFIGGSVLGLIFFIILILIMLIKLIQFLSGIFLGEPWEFKTKKFLGKTWEFKTIKFLGETWEFKTILYIEIILIVILLPLLDS